VIHPARTGVLTRDGRLLFATRIARLFGYGFLSVVLVLYLVAIGFDALQVGALLTLTLVGDAAISLWLTTHADRIGRRRVLIAGAALMVLAGVVFLLSRDLWVLVLAATIGVISPSGNEVGPFLAVEQAALSQTVADRQRTRASAGTTPACSSPPRAVRSRRAWSARASSAGQARLRATGRHLRLRDRRRRAGGAVRDACAGHRGGDPRDAPIATRLGLHRSQRVVARLAALFSLDAFAGGFVIQSIVSYWFATRFGMSVGALGALFFAANIMAGISALLAARVAARIGLVNTMVFTHLPSNVLLILVPFMPTAPLAVALLLARFSISQMDVPTRQSYTMAVVDPDERSAAAGVTGIARSVGAAVSPSLATPLVEMAGLAALPFVIAGSLKVVYDLLLFRSFRARRPPEESSSGQGVRRP
jgi:predicted MFS family arabinose efflux permease